MNIPKFLPFFLKISLPLYILDQITKWWSVLHFAEPFKGSNITTDPPLEVIPGFFYLNRIHNQGMAWGIGNGSAWAPLLFPVILVSALIGILIFWKKGGFPTRTTQVAGALVISGIIGNFTDRMVQGFFLEAYKDESLFTRWTEGYVVDLFDFYFQAFSYRYPCFNVADSCISIAATLLILSALFSKEYKELAK